LLPDTYTCSKCKCHALCRMRRKGLARLLSLFGLRPVLCLTCGKKSYLRLAEKDHFTDTRERPRSSSFKVTPISGDDRPRRAA
jgi:hypothetical protein